MRTWPAVFLLLLISHRAAAAEAVEDACPRPEAGGAGDARALYRDGERLYASGRYGESIAAFGAALARSGRPELYFDLANAHERMGRLAEAAGLLERYLRCARPADAGLVRERVRRLRSSAAWLARPSCPVSPGAALDDVAIGGELDERAEATAGAGGARPWLIAGSGAVAAALGLALAADAAALPPCAYPDEGRACASRPIDATAILEHAAVASAAAGAAALVTGAVLLARERRGPRPVPLVGTGMVGIAIGGDM